MRSLTTKALSWAHSHEGRKLIRYTAVSGISTVVSFVALFLIFGVFHWLSQVPATVCANLIATVPAYNLNRQWAWGKSGPSHLTKEIIPFWGMSLLGIGVSIIGASIARHIGIEHHMSHIEETALVLVANLASFGLFWVLKLLLFNRLFHFELEEFDDHLNVEEHATPEGV
jgi:putative flippase GtrA